MKNMSLEKIAAACGGTYYGDESKRHLEVSGVAIDSRKITEGFLFIPIKGARVDGHDFIPQVMEAGALCTLSEKEQGEVSYPYILVESCQQAIKDIAEHYRKSLDVKVVGITGSVGKTSTKEMIASVLEQKYCVLKTAGNYNNEIGLPLTVFQLTEAHEIAILEMGISDFGEMHRLTKIARPDVCVITNIGLCHLENLKSREGILQAKTEIFDFMQEHGDVILNGEDGMLETITDVKGKKPLFFGLSDRHAIYADQVEDLGLKGTSCRIHFPEGNALTATISIPGSHMVLNALAGASVGYKLGLTTEEIQAGIEALKPVSGRNNLIETDSLTVIDDCYNANPVSMNASLDVLATAKGRKVAILGDMGELGENQEELHYGVGVHAAYNQIDVIICIGKLSQQTMTGASRTITHDSSLEGCQVGFYPTKEEFLKEADTVLKKTDTVLVKASHFMDFPVIVKALQELEL